MLVVVVVGCDVTSMLPEGSYLVSKVTIEEDKLTPPDERITDDKDGIEYYIRQSPNKRILGMDFYVWVYEKIDTTKNNWWNRFKAQIGEEPVIYDQSLTDISVKNLSTYLNTRGYFSSKVDVKVDTTRRHRRAEITYTIHQGEPMRINRLEYEILDKSVESLILADTSNTLLRHGEILDISHLDEERERIATNLNNQGFYDFTVNNISYNVDTLIGNNRADVQLVVNPKLAGYSVMGAPQWEDNSVYRLRNINVYPTYDPTLRMSGGFKSGANIDTTYFYGLNIIRDVDATPRLRDAVLRRTIPLYPSFIYSAEQVDKSYNELMSLGFFRNAKIEFTPVDSEASYVSYIAHEGNNDVMVNTRESYLDCNIYCTPALKQSVKVELEATSTSTFYGMGATLGYSNSNVFRGAEAFDISAGFGWEFMYARDVKKRSAHEFSITAGLSFPRFLAPVYPSPESNIWQPRTRLELSFDYQNRPYYCRNLFSARWAYSWNLGRRSSFVLRPIDINWIDVKSVDEDFLADIDNMYLRTSFESQLNAGLSASYVYNTQRSSKEMDGTALRLNLETSGNLIQGLESLFSHHAEGKNHYEILGIRYSQYVRADLNLRHKIDFGHNLALAGRIFGGVGVTYGNSAGYSIPFDRMFYCGGANSMRGWAPRTLGPGNKAQVTDAVYPAQVGDVRLEANVEFRFPIWWIFHGATFIDVGNVWYLRNTQGSAPEEVFHFNKFYKQLGVNTGLGLRIDAYFVILRIDWGLQLHNPGWAEGERWIHNFKWDNMAINFGVGYPF
jgi:hypothetical protein